MIFRPKAVPKMCAAEIRVSVFHLLCQILHQVQDLLLAKNTPVLLMKKPGFFCTLAWKKFQRLLKSTFLILLSISFDFEQGYCFEAKNAYIILNIQHIHCFFYFYNKHFNLKFWQYIRNSASFHRSDFISCLNYLKFYMI